MSDFFPAVRFVNRGSVTPRDVSAGAERPAKAIHRRILHDSSHWPMLQVYERNAFTYTPGYKVSDGRHYSVREVLVFSRSACLVQ